MSVFDKIRAAYPEREAAYPADWPRPTRDELDAIVRDFGVTYPDDFVAFQLAECHRTPMGDFACDNFGWAHPALGPMENLRHIVADARSVGVPEHLAPFRHDNGDYECCDATGAVVVWDHNAAAVDPDPKFNWPTFSDWLVASLDGDV